MTIDSERRAVLTARFHSRIKRCAGCWEWTGAYSTLPATPRPIMRVHTDGTRAPWYAYRVSYVLFVGAIPDGCDIHHICGNPRCVNPSHLQPVPADVNRYRMRRRNRQGRF